MMLEHCMMEGLIVIPLFRKVNTSSFFALNIKSEQVSRRHSLPTEMVKENGILAAYREMQCFFAVVRNEDSLHPHESQLPLSNEVDAMLQDFVEICVDEISPGLPPIQNV